MTTGKCQQTFAGHKQFIMSIAIHPDRDIVVSGSHDRTIKIWNIQTGKCLKTFKATRLYEGMNIQDITGLTSAQKITLETLGSVV